MNSGEFSFGVAFSHFVFEIGVRFYIGFVFFHVHESAKHVCS